MKGVDTGGSGIKDYIVVHAPIVHIKDKNQNIIGSVQYAGDPSHLHIFYNMPRTATIRTPINLPSGTAYYQIDYCLGGKIVDYAGNESEQKRVCLLN